jgi:hypothetical protein
MFYTINRPPPLSMLQEVLPENPRVYWVAADAIAKLEPRNEELVQLIVEKRRGDVTKVRDILIPLMELGGGVGNIPPDEVHSVQQDLLTALLQTAGRRRFKTPRLMSKKYCRKTPCRRMGFTQKASCRPYKNCYTRRRLTKKR